MLQSHYLLLFLYGNSCVIIKGTFKCLKKIRPASNYKISLYICLRLIKDQKRFYTRETKTSQYYVIQQIFFIPPFPSLTPFLVQGTQSIMLKWRNFRLSWELYTCINLSYILESLLVEWNATFVINRNSPFSFPFSHFSTSSNPNFIR